MPQSIHFMDLLPIILMSLFLVMLGIIVVFILVAIIAVSYIKNEERYKKMCKEKEKLKSIIQTKLKEKK